MSLVLVNNSTLCPRTHWNYILIRIVCSFQNRKQTPYCILTANIYIQNHVKIDFTRGGFGHALPPPCKLLSAHATLLVNERINVNDFSSDGMNE